MGSPLDHHRYLPSRIGSRPCSHHGWRGTRTTCSPTVPKGSRRKPKLPARNHQKLRRTEMSGSASSTNGCRTSPSSQSPTTRRLTSSGNVGRRRWEPLREELNDALGRSWEEWEIPREPGDPWPEAATSAWNKLGAAETVQAKEATLRSVNRALNRHYTLDNVPNAPRDPWEPAATDLHTRWWEARIARQQEIDASIAAKADFEYLYDKPYEDRRKVRVAGPFTVESISPHRSPRRRRKRRAYRQRGGGEARLRGRRRLRERHP